MQTPLGFSFAGVPAGLKPVRRDVALVVSDVPCAAVAAFTTNLAAVSPVIDARPCVPAGGIRAVVVNGTCIREEGRDVVSVHISGGISGTVESARQAAIDLHARKP